MLKMGTYGLIRFCLPLFPNAAHARTLRGSSSLAIIGIVYGALVAMVQPNMKKLVAYSSVSHLGFVVLGIFSFTQMGLDGAVYQMLDSRHLDRRALRSGRLPVRAPAFAGDLGLRRRRHCRALALDRLPDHHAGQHRAAHAEQFHRRIPGPAGHRPGQLHLDRLRRSRRDPLRLLHALAVPARLLRRSQRRGPAPHARISICANGPASFR